MDIMAKVKEAEIYIAMGLLEDGRKVYDQIRSSGDVLDEPLQHKIAGKILELDNEINQLGVNDSNSVSENELALFKQTLSLTNESLDVLASAASFMELGLYKEALREYGKLFGRDHGWRDIIPKATVCLLKCCSSDEILDYLNETIDDRGIDASRKAEINFLIGQELEKKNLRALAVKFYDSNKGLNQRTTKLNRRLKSLISIPRLLTAFASIFAIAVISYLVAVILQIRFLFSLIS